MTISIEPVNAGHFAAMDKVRSGKPGSNAKPRNNRGNDHHNEPPPVNGPEAVPDGGWTFYGDAAPAKPRWAIKYILPETGVAFLSGQWGMYKTTTALDMILSIMSGGPFAGHRVKRRGAALFFALEGGSNITMRLDAQAKHRGIEGPLPFAWRGDCPSLIDKDAGSKLCRYADNAIAQMKRRWPDLPIVAIFIDTVVIAAGYSESGQDNDTAATAKVISAMRALSNHTGAVVVGIDHFGKIIETGTKGSSNKESSADTVLAVLGDREVSGGVKNTRLAVRKQRDGAPAGFELPFTANVIETGIDEDGDVETAVILDWQAARAPESKRVNTWPPTERLLRRILITALADSGSTIQPFSDGPMVRACDIETVRSEFYRQYSADGDDKKKSNTRRQAWNRAVKGARNAERIGTREINGTQFIWLGKEDQQRDVT